MNESAKVVSIDAAAEAAADPGSSFARKGEALRPLLQRIVAAAEALRHGALPEAERRQVQEILTAGAAGLNLLEEPAPAIKAEPEKPATITEASGAAPVPSAAAPAPAAPKPGELYPVSILLADDNPINQRVGLQLVNRVGCVADLASNGLETLEAIARKHYDVLLLDIQMPGMDGYQVAQEIRQREQAASAAGAPAKQMVIIAVTANAVRGDRERMMAAGMNDFLAKPVDFASFEKMMVRWMRQLQMMRASGKREAGVAEVAVPPAPEPASAELVAEPGAASGAPPVDLARFRELAGGGADDARSLSQLFHSRTSELVRQLQLAVAEGRGMDAKQLAHKGLGSSGTCGMDALAARFQQVERLCGAGQTEAARPFVEGMAGELERVQQFLNAEFSKL